MSTIRKLKINDVEVKVNGEWVDLGSLLSVLKPPVTFVQSTYTSARKRPEDYFTDNQKHVWVSLNCATKLFQDTRIYVEVQRLRERIANLERQSILERPKADARLPSSSPRISDSSPPPTLPAGGFSHLLNGTKSPDRRTENVVNHTDTGEKLSQPESRVKLRSPPHELENPEPKRVKISPEPTAKNAKIPSDAIVINIDDFSDAENDEVLEKSSQPSTKTNEPMETSQEVIDMSELQGSNYSSDTSELGADETPEDPQETSLVSQRALEEKEIPEEESSWDVRDPRDRTPEPVSTYDEDSPDIWRNMWLDQMKNGTLRCAINAVMAMPSDSDVWQRAVECPRSIEQFRLLHQTRCKSLPRYYPSLIDFELKVSNVDDARKCFRAFLRAVPFSNKVAWDELASILKGYGGAGITFLDDLVSEIFLEEAQEDVLTFFKIYINLKLKSSSGSTRELLELTDKVEAMDVSGEEKLFIEAIRKNLRDRGASSNEKPVSVQRTTIETRTHIPAERSPNELSEKAIGKFDASTHESKGSDWLTAAEAYLSKEPGNSYQELTRYVDQWLLFIHHLCSIWCKPSKVRSAFETVARVIESRTPAKYPKFWESWATWESNSNTLVAFRVLDRARELYPDVNILERHWKLLEREGHTGEMHRVMEEYLVANPKDGRIWTFCARNAHRMGHKKQAIQIFEWALEHVQGAHKNYVAQQYIKALWGCNDQPKFIKALKNYLKEFRTQFGMLQLRKYIEEVYSVDAGKAILAGSDPIN